MSRARTCSFPSNRENHQTTALRMLVAQDLKMEEMRQNRELKARELSERVTTQRGPLPHFDTPRNRNKNASGKFDLSNSTVSRHCIVVCIAYSCTSLLFIRTKTKRQRLRGVNSRREGKEHVNSCGSCCVSHSFCDFSNDKRCVLMQSIVCRGKGSQIFHNDRPARPQPTLCISTFVPIMP